MLTTTTNKILKHHPCVNGWQKLTGQMLDPDYWIGNADVLAFTDIVKSNNLDDAFWALRTLKDIHSKKLFALAKAVYKLRESLIKQSLTNLDNVYTLEWNTRDYLEAIGTPENNLVIAIHEYVFGMVYFMRRQVKCYHREKLDVKVMKILTDYVGDKS